MRLTICLVVAAVRALTLPGARRTFLLDRDGVINRDVGSPGVVDEGAFEILPGVADAVARARRYGHKVAVVTNQSARAKGLLSAATLEAIHARLPPVDAVVVATGIANDGSPALKPSPDSLLEALRVCGGTAADAVFVGDARTDMVAAARAGMPAVLVTSSQHGVACAAALEEGVLRDKDGEVDATVDAVFNDLPAALSALTSDAAPRGRRGALSAFAAAATATAAIAAPVPEGCVWKGEGEYPGRVSGQDVKGMNANLDCNANFYRGFGASEFVVTPLILGVAAFAASRNKNPE